MNMLKLLKIEFKTKLINLLESIIMHFYKRNHFLKVVFDEILIIQNVCKDNCPKSSIVIILK